MNIEILALHAMLFAEKGTPAPWGKRLPSVASVGTLLVGTMRTAANSLFG